MAGDWFYSKIEEKYKHELHSMHGSDVVRSSIRRLNADFTTGEGDAES